MKHSKRKIWLKSPALCGCLAIAMICLTGAQAYGQEPQKTAEVEGITEYRLHNGVKLLLFPDNSKPQFTLNMTVLVGSRHEGYGESGMAHLLEHMLFRGSDMHPDIPKLLKDRGVLGMNGTTSIDRTNYFETLPATEENLEFAISMEADRLINSWIKAEHLEKEMTIVRSEFERSENNPQAILYARLMDAAYQWHNYGKSTIGNRSDIMRVPADNLRVFYKKYYQPDNITLVIAGKFDKARALELVEEKFGAIPRPKRELPKTYTEEPAQDGERVVVLRRAGDVQTVGVAYHIPSASNEQYAPAQVLASILSNQPTGTLYKSMVEPKIAASAAAFARVGHDPGMMIAMAEVPKDRNLIEARDIMIEQLEDVANNVTEADVKRAVLSIMKGREQRFANTQSFATALSEWESYGDWRLFFLHRDRLEKVTVDDVKKVAQDYLIESNRTVGLFYPTEDAVRAEIASDNLVGKMVAGYKGRAKISEGEAFDPSPENIQNRTSFGKLESGLQYALLPKETRGDRVTLQADFRYGNEDSLKGKTVAAEMLPALMSRGTKNLSFQAYQDKLDELKTSVSISGAIGNISLQVQTDRDNLIPALDVVRQALREPALEASELEIIRDQMVTGIENGLSDPSALAFKEFSRRLDPQSQDDVRYTPTLEEDLERAKAVSLADVKNLFSDFLNGEHGEVAVVGDFDQDATLAKLNEMFAGWKSDEVYKRIPEPANLDVKGGRFNIDTPDKANAIYIAGLTNKIGQDHPQYEAMEIGNYIMGGGPLSSRIADRVRKQDGLSYTAMTRFMADAEDDRGMYMMFCISNPMNTEKVVSTVKEEVDRMLSSGVTGEELDKAKESFLTNRKGGRARDGRIAGDLLTNMKTGRTMEFQSLSDKKISQLTKEQVDAAIRATIKPERLVIVTAGDFSKEVKANEDK
ncbi:MAG: pitrilysin family protein [Mariniblastus sp.]|nr:pitrilysin family protein [Mariniblastus sp.]